MTFKNKVFEVLVTEYRFLTFREARPNLKEHGNYYLALGLISAWLAGIGRYWDNPRADLWQYLGLGSLVYVFILAIILWLLVLPLRPNNWSYKNVLTFVGLTSPPGILYAIPVEQFFSMATASMTNLWFLVIVASWRVILLFLFLRRSAQLSGFTVFVAATLPLTIIVAVLTMLNLEHVVFRIMAGIAEHERSANDAAYGVLIVITFISVYLSPILLITYLVLVYLRRKVSRVNPT